MVTPTIIEINVEGEPEGQPRARHRMITPRGRPAFVHVYTPKSIEGWKTRVELACFGKVKEPITGLIHVHINAYFPRPQRLLTAKSPSQALPHGNVPDKDNVEKAITDAMKNAGVFRDDRQICGGATFKWYVAKGSKPGARIRIEILNPDGQLALSPESAP